MRGVKRVQGESEVGQSLVEFALTLPVLLLVLTGIATFGIGMNNYLMLTEATSVGARAVAVSRQQTTDPCAVAATAVAASASGLKASSLGYSFNFNGSSYTTSSCNSSSTSTGAAGSLVQGKTAIVTVTYPCSLTAYQYTFGSACTLTATTTEVVQ